MANTTTLEGILAASGEKPAAAPTPTPTPSGPDPMNWSGYGWSYSGTRPDGQGNLDYVYVDAEGNEHFGFAGKDTNPKTAGTNPTGAAGATGTTGTALTAAQQQAQQNTLAAVMGVFTQYGLTSLADKIKQYVKDGYTGDTIAILLRDTEEYKQRFPAMSTLAAKGRAISESSYIQYEQTAAQLERQYGLPSGMLSGSVTELLQKDISATEMAERVQLASANSLMAPKELKDTLTNYYGINAGGLTAYFLDPDIAAPLLEKQSAAARIGSEAVRQGVAMDVYGAENLQELGITQQQAAQGFQQVASSRELFSGVGDITSEQEMVKGLLAGDQTAIANVNRAAGARKARFQQGGEYLATSGGAVGLGSAATS